MGAWCCHPWQHTVLGGGTLLTWLWRCLLWMLLVLAGSYGAFTYAFVGFHQNRVGWEFCFKFVCNMSGNEFHSRICVHHVNPRLGQGQGKLTLVGLILKGYVRHAVVNMATYDIFLRAHINILP